MIEKLTLASVHASVAYVLGVMGLNAKENKTRQIKYPTLPTAVVAV